MKFEKLSQSKNSKIIFISGFIMAILLIVIINLFFTKAKYQVTQSVQIVNGKVNYSLADFNLMAIYLQKSNDGGETGVEGEYEKSSDGNVPTSGYKLKDLGMGEYDSYCMVDGEKNNSGITIKYTNGGVNFSGIKKQGTKCYLYFDVAHFLKDEVIAKSTNIHINNVTGPSCKEASNNCGGTNTNMKQNGIYEVEDDFGTSYIYRGTVNNNWVKFGKIKSSNEDIWWRIIRVNGNGTIRLIYAGTGPNAPSTVTNVSQIGTSAYNTNYNDNKYVGYMYGTKASVSSSTENYDGRTDSSRDDKGTKHAHTNEYDSTIKDVLEAWWNITNLGENSNIEKIDIDTGFCNDREPTSSNHSGYYNKTYGENSAGYAAVDRVWESGKDSYNTLEQRPTLKCGTDTSREYDLFTGKYAEKIIANGKKIEGNKRLDYPVGLITMDEVIYAGGFAGQNNKEYWLCTGYSYWTMSPSYFLGTGYAQVFFVTSNGYLFGNGGVHLTDHGVRPVINLKADMELVITADGTSNSPYIIV